MKNIPKIEERNLRCELTDEEINDYAKKLATKNRDAQSLEDDKKSVMSEFKFKSDMVKGEINLLSGKISNGYEFRFVDCDVRYHEPESGQKTMVRKDTFHSWSEKMTSEEWNLFNQVVTS